MAGNLNILYLNHVDKYSYNRSVHMFRLCLMCASTRLFRHFGLRSCLCQNDRMEDRHWRSESFWSAASRKQWMICQLSRSSRKPGCFHPKNHFNCAFTGLFYFLIPRIRIYQEKLSGNSPEALQISRAPGLPWGHVSGMYHDRAREHRPERPQHFDELPDQGCFGLGARFQAQ